MIRKALFSIHCVLIGACLMAIAISPTAELVTANLISVAINVAWAIFWAQPA